MGNRSELHRHDPKSEDQTGWEIVAGIAGRVLGDHLYAALVVLLVIVLLFAHHEWLAVAVTVAAPLLWYFTPVGRWSRGLTMRRRLRRSFSQVAVHLPGLADRHGRLPQIVRVTPIAHGLDVVVRLPAGVVPEALERNADPLVHGLANAAGGLRLHALRVFPMDPGFALMRLLETDPLAVPVAGRGLELEPFTFGLLESGPPLRWDPTKAPHCVVVGDVGAGKSSIMRAMLYSLSTDFDVVLLDEKRVEFGSLPRQGRILTVAVELDEIAQALAGEQQAMRDAYRLINDAGCQDWSQLGHSLRPRVVLFDEVAVTLGNSSKKAKEAVAEIRECLRQLVLYGHAAGWSIICGLQRPDAYILGGDMRDNMRGRIALGMMSRDGANMTFEDPEASRMLRSLEPGFGVAWRLSNDTATPTRMRSVHVSREALIARLTAVQ